MNIKVSKNLISLAKLLNCELFIVGGFVRNLLMKLPPSDIDICGKFTPKEVVDKLDGTKFKVIEDYASFGSLLIKIEDESYEYTTFRKDSYLNGCHKPMSVEFTCDMSIDAKRRDFTINALYYNIITKEIIDPTGFGLKDIESKVIRTCNGEQTFIEDGLRLLRLVRFSGEFGFKIDEKSLSFAKENASNLKDIASERKRVELDKILLCDVKYGEINSQRIFETLNLLQEIGLYEFLLPDLTKGVGLIQNPLYHKYDVFTHSIKACSYAIPRVRLAALLHDVGKPESFFTRGNFHYHNIIGYDITKRLLGQNGLKYPNLVVDRTSRLVREHMKDLSGDMKERKLRLYFAENIDILDDLIAVKIADGKGCLDGDGMSPTIIKWLKLYNDMKEEKLPFTVNELDIKGQDVIKIIGNDNVKFTGKVLNKLLEYVIVNEVKNDYGDLSEKVIKAYKEVNND